jgi:MFS family permease
MSGLRTLLALTGASIFLETLFYSVLSPLLPGLEAELGLSTSQAGLLVAVYPLGLMLAVLPAALCSTRVGVRPTMIAGLVVLAAASVAFGLADSLAALMATRFLQGVGGAAAFAGALVWLIEATPRQRRGETIGVAMSASAAGEVAGPVLGGIAAGVGRAATFTATAVVAVILVLVSLRFPAPAPGDQRRLPIRAALGSSAVRSAMLLGAVPGFLIGVVAVLAPLQLDRLGGGAGLIAVTFGVAAAAGVLVQPLMGRWSDRQGRMRPIRIGLLATVVLVLPIAWAQDRWLAAVLVAAALVTAGAFWGPAMALLSDVCDHAGVGQVLAIAIVQLAGTSGLIAGAAAAGATAGAVGQRATYVALAGVLLLSLLLITRRRSLASAEVSAAPT